MGPQLLAAPDYSKATDAKDFLDQIGQIVHTKVHGDAQKYYAELHGDLSKATFRANDGRNKVPAPQNACQLHHTVHTNVTVGYDKENPCLNRSNIRFSDVRGGECADSKIKGNKGSNGGACAPYRRLHLCDYNLENISDFDNINNHTLLVDVCLAAKYEGQSISGQHGKYHTHSSGSTICTVLARSFADIGDIIRGKDLYIRNKREKRRLEDNLKKIFQQIHDDVTKTSDKNGKALKTRYGSDAPDFLKLREDWWDANREKVWKAITCGAGGGKYFRNTCVSGKDRTVTRENCQCIGGTVPTYFDYVPQYLRWFEEWAEDFCTKRKKQLENAKKFCRGDEGKGEVKYCDLNRYDCTKTVIGEKKLVKGDDCYNCSVTCNPFVPWIDNQKEEFLKQREKYTNEISGGKSRKKRSINGDKYKGYDEEFYNILKREYRDVKKFLDLLSKETACESQPYDEGRTIGINFKNREPIDIFSHTEYCQACPWCGVKEQKVNGRWKAKNYGECAKEVTKEYKKDNITDIPVLTPDTKKGDMIKKYGKFCKDSNSQIKKWECYYDENIENSKENNNCIEGEWEKFKEGKTFRSYYFFFWIWVTEMLIDSIDWRTQLSKCINNESKPCKNGCKNNCDCYKLWVKEKKKEWEQIKKHFRKQKDMKKGIEQDIDPIIFLENVLDIDELFQNIKYTYGYVKEIDLINKMLKEDGTAESIGDVVNEENTPIDKLLKHEAQDANRCKNCEDTAPKQAKENVGRSADHGEDHPDDNADTVVSEEEEEEEDEVEEEEEENEEEEEENVHDGEAEAEDNTHAEPVDKENVDGAEVETPEKTTEDTGKGSEPVSPPLPPVNVCETVAKALEDTGSLQKACSTKYGSKAPTSWKCIGDSTTKPVSETARSSGEPTGGKDGATGGSICIPPRRRKLYVGKLEQWANSGNTGESKSLETTDTQTQSDTKTPSEVQTPQGQTPSQSGEKLRDAFIQSAAVETFFLWDRYKKENTKKPDATQGGEGLALLQGETPQEDPQKQLNSGTIPEEFKRQMFYTLGDYRDICIDVEDDVADALEKSVHNNRSGEKSNNITMKQISEKIKTILNSDNNKPSGVQNSVKDPKDWWDKNVESIWNGMICALTYKDSGAIGGTPQKIENPEKLWDEDKKEPKETRYQYKTVVLKDESSGTGGTKGQTESSSSSDTPLLSDFVKRPTYFRYLEEWGQNFCKERKKRLEEVRKGCRQKASGGDTYCGGDGHDCTDPDNQHNDMFADLYCPDCYEQCRKYRKWIDIKFEEFHKQKDKYKGEHDKLKANHNGDDKNIYEKLKDYTTADKFLESLKHCSNDVSDSDEDKLNKINFQKPLETFNPSTYCKACPVYGVQKNRGTYSAINESKYMSKNSISGENKNDKDPTDIEVLVLGRKGKDNNNDKKLEEVNNACKNTGLLEDTCVQNWTCQKKKNGIHECTIKNADKSDKSFHSKYFENKISFKILFQSWLIDFIEHYNKSKERITRCTNDANSCKQICNNKCDYVKQWLEIKGNEWQSIKEYYEEYFKDKSELIPSRVKSFFQQRPFENYYKKAQEVVEDPNKRDELWGCTDRDGCEQEENKEKYGDFITNLIKELKEKIGECKKQHQNSGETQNNCVQPSPLEEPDEPLDDYYIQQPKICPPPMTCVERAAKQLRSQSQSKIPNNSKLKANGIELSSICNKIKRDNDKMQDSSCDFDKTYKTSIESLNNPCYNNGKKRLNIEESWKCINTKKIGKSLCIPPRREGICIDDLKRVTSYSINDSSDLLKLIQKLAKTEADDIITKILQNNACHDFQICDALKYSFADLADIIRGREFWQRGTDYERIKSRLRRIFENIYNIMDPEEKSKYKDRVNYYELRSDWWDANRKHIWNAMTCNAPDAAKFLKKNPNDTSGSSSAKGIMTRHPKCGYDKDPPDYDYIPQPFRWMQEWSESFCKLLNEQIKKFETECADCKNNGVSCKDDKTGEKCEKCKKQCEKYKQIVHEWQNQFGKYKETYKEIYNNEDIKINSSEYFKNFLQKLKDDCHDLTDVDEYLDKSNNCINFTFRKGNKKHEKYAFKETPNDYVNACNCDPTDILHECPFKNGNQDACKSISTENICKKKNFDNDLDDWNSGDIPESTSKNNGVLVPPRRRQLCVKNMTTMLSSIVKKNDFKIKLLQSAYNEGYFLGKTYAKDKQIILQAMKYSFADYGDIVKGTDVMDNLKKLHEILKSILKTENGNNQISHDRKNWWTQNKTHVWHAMLCGYKKAGGTIGPNDCNIPSEENTPQFLRWFQEWGENFCTKRKELYDEVQNKCVSAECNTSNGSVGKPECTKACEKYKNYVITKIIEYNGQKGKYDIEFKDETNDKNIFDFFKKKCFNNNCNCLSENFKDETNWENPYESITDVALKDKCDCKKIKPVEPPPAPLPPTPSDESFDPTILQTTIPFGVALALGSIAFLFLKKKTKSSVGNLFQILQIPKSDYDIPTPKSSNRYIPYASDKYKGKTYIYMEGDSDEDKYAFIKITDNEWNTLKDEFISNMLQSEPKDVPNNYTSGDIPLNTQPNTLYFDNNQEKPFIMSIHDRNLYSGEEYSYNVNMVNSMNDIPISGKNDVYSGIDLINDSLNSNNVDIYDEVLKRKENELFGTNHVKQTSIHSVAKPARDDPIHNQLELFHTWLDRHRDMCEKWENHHERLAKLKEEWENDTSTSGNTHPSDSNKTLNTDVSIQIHMDNPKPINEFSNMDTILEDLEKYNEPYYDVQDDIYYDVHDHDTSTVDSNNMDVPSKVQIEMDINTKLVKEKYPIADVWDI
ncbi:hypothetical protein PFAG_06117 [Plasmodium falciparum Santa Lucia]|uniref:Duffy-binding-like domain-containing protein n=1 Tax=Plasmodium falciparum Santa Lucia TaxID=478859 RepID=W7FVN6_PLAFA|nr:hypothetical protein PFAG_06117 [Plasmodium falciparum Santa Lucia]